MNGSVQKWGLAVVLAISLACGAQSAFAAAASPPAQTTAASQSAAAGAVVPDYRLGAGDKIRVITFGEESLTGEFFVGGAGRVSLPLVGELQAAGKTAREFQSEVEAALKEGYIKEPRVSVEVLNYRPFYILGEVMKPGEYPYTNNLTVLNAVATASGYTYRADTKKVYIKRANETGEKVYPLTTMTAVAPGDTIRIGERFF